MTRSQTGPAAGGVGRGVGARRVGTLLAELGDLGDVHVLKDIAQGVATRTVVSRPFGGRSGSGCVGLGRHHRRDWDHLVLGGH